MGPSAPTASGQRGSRTPISCVQSRRRSVGPAARDSSTTRQGPPGTRTRSTSLPKRRAAGKHLRTARSKPQSSRRESNPRCLFVGEESSPLDHGTFATRIDTGGIRTHKHQTLSLAALPLAYRAVIWKGQLRVGESNLRVRAYETRPSTGPPASPRPRSRSVTTGLMKAGEAPATPGRKESPRGDSNSHTREGTSF